MHVGLIFFNRTIRFFDDFDEQYESIDIDWGNPVDEEIW